MKPDICAPSAIAEYTLCGMAFDAHESGDADEPIVMAKRGEIVTCEDCRGVIKYVKRSFKRNRYAA